MEKAAKNDPELTERNKIITIAGGIHLEVQHIDGTKETVKVRQIPATKLETFMTKLTDEANSVSIYCDRDTDWVDTLTQESVNQICEKGLEINESFLNAWCRRRAKWTEMMNVGVISELQTKLDALNAILASVTSAQKLPIITASAQKK
jgi:hypothetical protein